MGPIKMVTIRENRYPFLTKVGNWNRDTNKTGDTLVEKCCHFFDLFRLITQREVKTDDSDSIRAFAQRGLNYRHEASYEELKRPIIDSAYVTMTFDEKRHMTPDDGPSETDTCDTPVRVKTKEAPIGCLELCMFAEGSRHQEEIIVTGMEGRVEAYLPENKVFLFKRPTTEVWADRDEPPSSSAVQPTVFDCSDISAVHDMLTDSNGDGNATLHAGYHYCSTAVEWYWLLDAMNKYGETGLWAPHVSLSDGIRAVELGLAATSSLNWATDA